MTKKMKLADYIAGIRAATSAEELEAALKAPFVHRYIGRTWDQICNERIAAGNAICAAHPHGRFVPTFGPARRLTVCGETYRVGRGQNSTGVRYVWTYAGFWAKEVLVRNGLSRRAAFRVWDCWFNYPHRCLAIVEASLAGEIPDPELNHLFKHERCGWGRPVQVGDDDRRYRASRACACGGTLWDWGAGSSEDFEYINWHCDTCPDVFTEYMSQQQLYALRSSARAA